MRFEASESSSHVSCTVIHDDGQYMAQCTIYKHNQTLYNVFTYPDFRKMGVGSFMMREVMKREDHPRKLIAAPFGSDCLTIEQTINFYQKFGFIPIGSSNCGQPMEYAGDLQ